jgi:MoaA/NifB/PqqE/SkfB family radical SAM enzyme
MAIEKDNVGARDLYGDGFFSAYVEATDRCNLGCSYCYRSGCNPLNEDPKIGDLAKIRDNLESADIKKFFYGLSGGEITTRKDWAEILELFLETGKPVNLFTNATLIDKEEIKKISRLNAKYGGQLVVYSSLDSHIPEIHNRTRGKYEQTVRGLAELKSAGTNLRVSITLNKYNLPSLNETIEYIAQNFSKNIFIGNLLPVFPMTDENSDLFISLEQALEACKKGKEACVKNGWTLHSTFREDGRLYCDAGLKHVLVTTGGDVTPCLSLRQEKYIMGNLYKESFKTVLERMAEFNRVRERRVLLCEHLEDTFGKPPLKMERVQ